MTARRASHGRSLEYGAAVFLILDLEATCWRERHVHRGERETIEIGAVIVNLQYDVLAHIGTFIRPVRTPLLSAFCFELTGITQNDVDLATTFPEALSAVSEDVVSAVGLV